MTKRTLLGFSMILAPALMIGCAAPRVTKVELSAGPATGNSPHQVQNRSVEKLLDESVTSRSGEGVVRSRSEAQVFNNLTNARIEGEVVAGGTAGTNSATGGIATQFFTIEVRCPSRFMIAYTTLQNGSSASHVSLEKRRIQPAVSPLATNVSPNNNDQKSTDQRVLVGELSLGTHTLSVSSLANGSGAFAQTKFSAVISSK